MELKRFEKPNDTNEKPNDKLSRVARRISDSLRLSEAEIAELALLSSFIESLKKALNSGSDDNRFYRINTNEAVPKVTGGRYDARLVGDQELGELIVEFGIREDSAKLGDLGVGWEPVERSAIGSSVAFNLEQIEVKEIDDGFVIQMSDSGDGGEQSRGEMYVLSERPLSDVEIVELSRSSENNPSKYFT